MIPDPPPPFCRASGELDDQMHVFVLALFALSGGLKVLYIYSLPAKLLQLHIKGSNKCVAQRAALSLLFGVGKKNNG